MFDKVVEIIMKYSDIKADQIHRDSHLINDLSLDSFAITEMLCDMEDTLGVEIPEDHIMKFRTVEDIVTYLEKIV